MMNVLYIHGMGGGGDSRIPSILNDSLSGRGVRIIARTYDFNPETASGQICAWISELNPCLIIGESLGSVHAIRIKGIPHILISPALNTPLYFSYLAWMAFIPGMTWLLDRIYRPKEGDRQKLHFSYFNLSGYGSHRKAAVANSTLMGSEDYFHAFIGTRDHYRRTGIVSIRTWKKYFGDTCTLYDGTHYTEEEHLHVLVVPKILEILGLA